MRIATIINYCTNDYRFLGRCIEETRIFSSQTIVPVSDSFFNGEKENRPLLETTYRENPNTLFIEFAYSPEKLYTPFIVRSSEDSDWVCLWHSTARYIAASYADPDVDFLLFLDADEIPEGEKFAAWLHAQNTFDADAYWFSAYQYGFTADQQLAEHQQTGLLVRRSAIAPLQIYSAQERFGLFAAMPGKKWLQITGLDGKPMIHHYSWVRPRVECLQKARTWGKRTERDWIKWLDQPFRDTQKVTPYFDPLQVPIRATASGPIHNVICVDDKSIQARELNALLNPGQ